MHFQKTNLNIQSKCHLNILEENILLNLCRRRIVHFPIANIRGEISTLIQKWAEICTFHERIIKTNLMYWLKTWIYHLPFTIYDLGEWSIS